METNDRNTNTEIELGKFLQMKIPSGSNLLLFYKEHENLLPILTKVAREIFAIPASSATSERVFSVGSLICTARRSRLTPDKVSDLMLMRLNSADVDVYKKKNDLQTKFKPDEIRNLITTDLEGWRGVEEEEEEYVEDLEGEDSEEEDLEGEDLNVPDEVVMFEVEDNLL